MPMISAIATPVPPKKATRNACACLGYTAYWSKVRVKKAVCSGQAGLISGHQSLSTSVVLNLLNAVDAATL